MNKKKKGFTLVELVVTIAIMLVIVGIAVPSAVSMSNKSKQKSYNVQVKEFEAAAESYVLDNKNKWNIENISGKEYCFSLSDLLSAGYIKEIPDDPTKKNEKFTGSVNIKTENIDGVDVLKYTYSVSSCTGNKRLVDAGLNALEEYDDTLNLGDDKDDIADDGNKLLSEVIIENNPIDRYDVDINFNSSADTDEGLIEGVEGSGKTYFFRGAVEDNYLMIQGLKWKNTYIYYGIVYKESSAVDYMESREEAEYNCGLNSKYYGYSSANDCLNNIREFGHYIDDDILFRIVRITEKSLIKIVPTSPIKISKFNNSYNDEKYVGYRYDSSISSNIKKDLDNWYAETIQSDDNNFEDFFNPFYTCNDTSISNTNSLYSGAYDRLELDTKPTFDCPTSKKTYGGNIDASVGLLSADEYVFSGYSYFHVPAFILSTPRSFKSYLPEMYYASGNKKNPELLYSTVNSSRVALPVLALASDILYESGDGTKSNPYRLTKNQF